MSALTQMPSAFRAGTTVKYTRTFSSYSASQGWTLTLELAGRDRLTKAADVSGAAFSITLTAAETALLRDGNYEWVERVTKGDEAYDADSGQTTVLRNPATAVSGSSSSWEEEAIEAVKASILGAATTDQEQLQVQNQMIQRYSLAEKKQLLAELEARVQARRTGRLGRLHEAVFRRPR